MYICIFSSQEKLDDVVRVLVSCPWNKHEDKWKKVFARDAEPAREDNEKLNLWTKMH